MNGGDRIAIGLARQGVRFLFTLCGGHISPILVGAKRLGIRVVDVRDEVAAVFAADAVARLTGVPGVAAVPAGPGVTNTVPPDKNAQLAHSPEVVLGGRRRPRRGRALAVARAGVPRGAERRPRAGLPRVPDRPALRRGAGAPDVRDARCLARRWR